MSVGQGYQQPRWGSMNTQQNPNGYGGPGMRYGQPSGDPTNMQYAAQNLPGTPYAYQQQAAGLYSTPYQSDPNQYGRWNWANQMGGGNSSMPGTGTPYIPPVNGGQPPIPPGTPPPTGGGQPPPQTGGGQPPPGQPQPTQSPIAGGGDIASFANSLVGMPGGSIGGPQNQFVMHPQGLHRNPGPGRGNGLVDPALANQFGGANWAQGLGLLGR